MYLAKTKRVDGRIYLSAVHGYRDSQGNVKSTTIQSFGYVHDLAEKFDDPIAHFGAVVDRMEAERLALAAPLVLEVDLSETLSVDAPRKNLGFAALSHIFSELSLDSLFRNIGARRKIDYSLGSVVKLLVFDRILHPGSKKSAYEHKESYFERFAFSADQMYRTLDVLASVKERITKYMHKQITAVYGRDTSLVYYDVTNYYFESESCDGLKARGVCKEHRPNPIIQMGLLTDTSGIPITYELFEGNTNDCITLLPVLAKVKRQYGLSRVIVVADKGLNTSDNIAYNEIKGDGYIFSGSLRKADGATRAWALNDKGFRKHKDGTKTKSRIEPKILYIEGMDGKKKDIDIDQKQVVLYSPTYDRRAKAQREAVLKKARDLIAQPAVFNRATSRGAAKYVKNLTFVKGTGEIADGKSLQFDAAKLAREEELDGYYMICTSELDMPDRQIIAHYRGLAKIEDCFRVTKSDISTRPVYVWNDERIQAHFLTCFISLTFLRILQAKTGGEYSCAKLIEAMNAASGSHVKENLYVFDYKSEVLDAIGAACGIDFSKKFMPLAQIKSIVANSKRK